jgi:hypothetical protein
MTIKITKNITCNGDKCDKHRDADTNHWWVGYAGKGYAIIAVNREALSIRSMRESDAVLDFCGEECASKWVSRQFTEMREKAKCYDPDHPGSRI